MAYDPEARRQSNAALIIGLIALLVVGGGTVAYFATRTPEPGPTTVISSPGRTNTVVVEKAVPVPAPGVIITNSTPVVVPNGVPNTIIRSEHSERNTVTTRERVIVPPSSTTTTTNNAPPASRESNTTVNVNNAPASSNVAPAAPNAPATDSGSTAPATDGGAVPPSAGSSSGGNVPSDSTTTETGTGNSSGTKNPGGY